MERLAQEELSVPQLAIWWLQSAETHNSRAFLTRAPARSKVTPLKELLQALCKSGRQVRTDMEAWALEVVQGQVDVEMESLVPSFKVSASKITVTQLLGFDLFDAASLCKRQAPATYAVLKSASRSGAKRHRAEKVSLGLSLSLSCHW